MLELYKYGWRAGRSVGSRGGGVRGSIEGELLRWREWKGEQGDLEAEDEDGRREHASFGVSKVNLERLLLDHAGCSLDVMYNTNVCVGRSKLGSNNEHAILFVFYTTKLLDRPLPESRL